MAAAGVRAGGAQVEANTSQDRTTWRQNRNTSLARRFVPPEYAAWTTLYVCGRHARSCAKQHETKRSDRRNSNNRTIPPEIQV